MTSARELKDTVVDAFNQHDVPGIVRCFAPRAVLVSPTGLAEGREQISWYYEHLFEGFPDIKFTAWNKPLLDDPAVTEYMYTGTHQGPFLLADGSVLQATGRHIAVRGVAVCSIENGLITTDRDYYDQLELYAQLGIPFRTKIPA
ncbi:ester cyclase [Nonomuraea fuscirosea]|jgi:ketosteroid isomerase-like protein|uniref:ester cyclase n=1 Tax=Nonomuraea fuscirosea TaxID=1291556 RepID=UPI002DD99435|nr:ester cyclase [Nonomuraea fuscirosea]WSA56113.1 ester cyclase [Nonomuraea fuscirosea]